MDNGTYEPNANPSACDIPPPLRPRLSFFHANARGTGCAVMLELRPAYGIVEGCIMMTLANQLTVGDRRGPSPVYPTFDMDNRMVVKLGFPDLTKMLQVFRGECESIDGEKGLFHRAPRFSTQVTLRHRLEPVPGYALDVFRSGGDMEDRHADIVLTPAEAMGLTKAVEASLGVLCFGIPAVTEYERRQELALRQAQAKPKEGRDVRAA